MARAENEVWKATQLALARTFPRDRLFRNNNGSAWAGPGLTLKAGQVYRAQGGERLIIHPSHVDFGLWPGSGDGIGWHMVTITPAMIGQRLPVFLSVETKAGRGKMREAQTNWQEQVNAAGGIALEVHDARDLARLIAQRWQDGI